MIDRSTHMIPKQKLTTAAILCAALTAGCVAGMEQGSDASSLSDLKLMEQVHDIASLPAWGPYSQTYAGISHIPDMNAGLRFDVSLIPGFYRGGVLIPNVDFISGYYPWDINASLTRVTYRYELEWKDQVYVDATYALAGSNAVQVALHCVNNTALPQNLALNLMAWIAYPKNYPAVRAETSHGAQWINAVDYESLIFAQPGHADHLVYDGWMRGEVRGADYVDGRAVGCEFGKTRGDRVRYSITLPSAPFAGEIALRCRMKKNARLALHLDGLVHQTIELVGTGGFELLRVPFSGEQGGEHVLSIESAGGAPVEFNGFFLQAEGAADSRIVPQAEAPAPQADSSGRQRVILKYADVSCYYGLAWDFPQSELREFKHDELDIFFRRYLHNHVQKTFVGNKRGNYNNVFLRPVEIAPQSERTIRFLLCNGTLEEVKQELSAFNQSPASEAISSEAPADSFKQNVLPEGRPYVFSQKMMRATLLSNVVYPVYTQGEYIRHFAPGKWWDSLYTWDSGFIAAGLLEVNPRLAAECINAYTTPPGSQSAFIHHGSVVPTQIFAFWDLWNRTQSRELLVYMYPRLKQYYDFVSGRNDRSTTRTLSSGLLKTWDYFYNSGGWDDYPAQKAVHAQRLKDSTTPVITTAQCIREAKMLRMYAGLLSLPDDVRAYDQDIKDFTDALQEYAWDPNSGYYSYVMHDPEGKPSGFLTYGQEKINYNQGLDGAYPLMSGICTPEQERILVDRIFSPTNLWTSAGISVVDQSAPYYRNDGYWNGAVWMPHQWFMWKTMLDLGQADLARRIAQRGLDVWKSETDATYYTFEHFLASNGRGAGWHQFSGLSTPVLSWFSAYYRPGTATVGFSTLIHQQQFGPDCHNYRAELIFDRATQPHARSLILCMNPRYEYEVTFNGRKLNAESPYPGLLQITLPAGSEDGQLVVTHP